MSFGTQLPDISFGRYPDGGNEWVYMPEPSYSGSNLPGINDVTRVSAAVGFSSKGGLFSGPLTVELSAESESATIRYTTDGTWPDLESAIYRSPISITSNKTVRARSFEEGYLPGPVCTET